VCVRGPIHQTADCQCTKTVLCTSGAIFRSIKTSRAQHNADRVVRALALSVVARCRTGGRGDSCSAVANRYTVAKRISRFPWPGLFDFFPCVERGGNLFGMYLLLSPGDIRRIQRRRKYTYKAQSVHMVVFTRTRKSRTY